VSVEGDRFTLQGDNNTWLDPDHPSPAEVIGRLVVRVPAGGHLLAGAGNPYLLAIGGGLMTLAGGILRRVRLPGRPAARSTGRRAVQRAPAPIGDQTLTTVITACACTGAGLLAVGVRPGASRRPGGRRSR
jgi:hypothetical protein